MEGNVILTHELIKIDIIGFPPFFIVLSEQIGCDWYVADWGIKPNIKYFFLELFDRDSYTPFKVPSNAFRFQTHIGPSFSCRNGVFGPFSLDTGLINPFFELFLNFREVDKEMNSISKNGSLFANVTVIVLHLGGVIE